MVIIYNFKMDDLPNYVYYDLNLKNYSNDIELKQSVRFYETRQSAIIEDCSQYDMSIVRFYVSTPTLPVYIAEIQPGSNQTDPNKMLHTITMEVRRGNAGSTIYCTGPQHLTWIPQDLSIPAPPAPSSNNDRFHLQSVSDYYFAYNYDHLCVIINNTLSSLAASLSSFDPYFTDITPPMIIFDQSDNKFVFIARQNLYQTDRPFPSPQGDKEVYVTVYFNKSLYNLLSTFYFVKQNINSKQLFLNQTYGYLNMNYQLQMNSFNNAFILRSSDTNVQPMQRYLEIKQMSSTVGCINPVSTIIFTSDAIPIIPNSMNKPHLLYNNNTIYYSPSQQQDSSLNIISDFSPGADMIIRSDVSYLPEGEYRFISLSNNKQELRNIDIQIYWLDTFGVLHPLYLLSGGSCSVKLMFKKKNTTV
jgi:hypothetical protein